MKVDDFLEGFSLFAEAQTTYHDRDNVRYLGAEEHRNKFFPEVLEEKSAWQAQTVMGGLTVELTDGLVLSGAVQYVCGGKFIYKTTTAICSLTVNF
jgi:hypothetical protein